MASSVGAAAAQGLESGFGLGLRIRSAERDEEELQRRRRIEDEELQWQRRDRERRLQQQDDDRALKAYDEETEILRNEGAGHFARYGEKVPPEIAQPYQQRVRKVTEARTAALRRRWPVMQQDAADTVTRMTTGEVDPLALPAGQLYRALAVSARRDPNDLIGVDGQPSRVSKAMHDLSAGIQTGNEGMTLRAANVLLEPELRAGIGSPSPYGGHIVGKEIVKLMPHPHDPKQTLPVIKVYVSRGKPKTAGEVAQAERVQSEPGAPLDATGYYLAPITEGRSSDPADPVIGVSVEKAMQYAAQLDTLSSVISSRPELVAKITRGAGDQSQDADSFLQAFLSTGGKLPDKQFTMHNVPEGGLALQLDPQGRVVQRISGPEKPAPTTGLAGQITAVQRYAQEQGITEDEAARRLQRQGLMRPGKGAGLAGAGSGGTPSSTLTGDAFLKTLPSGDQALVLAIVEGRAKAPELSTKDGRRLNALVQRYDGTFDAQKGGFKNEDSLRDEYVKASGDFVKIRNAYGLVQAAAKDPSAGGDMALIFAFMRILDPSSVVREGEFATAQNAAGVPDRVVNLYNRLVNGERLNPTQRADFVNQARKIYDEQKGQNEVLQGTYRDMAKRYKLNPENVVVAIGRDPGQPPQRTPGAGGSPALPTAALSSLKEGQVTTFGNGQRWTLQNGQPVQVR